MEKGGYKISFSWKKTSLFDISTTDDMPGCGEPKVIRYSGFEVGEIF